MTKKEKAAATRIKELEAKVKELNDLLWKAAALIQQFANR